MEALRTQLSAASLKSQPQKRCWEKRLMCVNALQVPCFRTKWMMTRQSEITRISDFACNAAGTGLLKEKKTNQPTVILLFLLQGWMLQTNVSQLNFWCGWMQQNAPPGRVQRVVFCMVAARNRHMYTWKSLFYKAFVHLWELRSLSVMKLWKTSRNVMEKLSVILNWVSRFGAFKRNICYHWLWKNLVDLFLELDSMRGEPDVKSGEQGSSLLGATLAIILTPVSLDSVETFFSV